MDIKDRVLNVLNEVDEHYRLIVKEAWKTVKATDSNQDYGSKNSAMKIIATVNKDRAKMFQDAGINQDTEMIEEMNETNRKQEIIKDILREIKQKHPEIAQYIALRMSEIQDEVEVIAIEGGTD